MLCLVTALFSTSVPRPHHKSASDFSGLVLSCCEFTFHGACLFLGVSWKSKIYFSRILSFEALGKLCFLQLRPGSFSAVSDTGISFHIFGEAGVLGLFHLKIGIFNYFELKVTMALRFCHYYHFSFLIKYLIFIYAYNVFICLDPVYPHSFLSSSLLLFRLFSFFFPWRFSVCICFCLNKILRLSRILCLYEGIVSS